MRNSARLVFSVFLLAPLLRLHADPQPAQSIMHPESECIVKATEGEYPSYSVTKGKKTIYSPTSDGIGKVFFSPSGKYIAFSGSEINWVDIGKEYFSVVVLKCSSGELRGFQGGYPNFEFRWTDDRTLKYVDSSTEKEVTVEIVEKIDGSFELTGRGMPSN